MDSVNDFSAFLRVKTIEIKEENNKKSFIVKLRTVIRIDQNFEDWYKQPFPTDGKVTSYKITTKNMHRIQLYLLLQRFLKKQKRKKKLN